MGTSMFYGLGGEFRLRFRFPKPIMVSDPRHVGSIVFPP